MVKMILLLSCLLSLTVLALDAQAAKLMKRVSESSLTNIKEYQRKALEDEKISHRAINAYLSALYYDDTGWSNSHLLYTLEDKYKINSNKKDSQLVIKPLEEYFESGIVQMNVRYPSFKKGDKVFFFIYGDVSPFLMRMEAEQTQDLDFTFRFKPSCTYYQSMVVVLLHNNGRVSINTVDYRLPRGTIKENGCIFKYQSQLDYNKALDNYNKSALSDDFVSAIKLKFKESKNKNILKFILLGHKWSFVYPDELSIKLNERTVLKLILSKKIRKFFAMKLKEKVINGKIKVVSSDGRMIEKNIK